MILFNKILSLIIKMKIVLELYLNILKIYAFFSRFQRSMCAPINNSLIHTKVKSNDLLTLSLLYSRPRTVLHPLFLRCIVPTLYFRLFSTC